MFYIFYLINFATQRLQQATFFLLSKYGLSHPLLVLCLPGVLDSAADNSSVSQWVFTIMEKVPHFTFKTLIRNYAKTLSTKYLVEAFSVIVHKTPIVKPMDRLQLYPGHQGGAA